MLRLEDIKKDAAINGIEPGEVVRIVTTEPVGDSALTVYYRTADGRVKEQMLFRSSEASLSLAEAGRRGRRRSRSRITRSSMGLTRLISSSWLLCWWMVRSTRDRSTSGSRLTVNRAGRWPA